MTFAALVLAGIAGIVGAWVVWDYLGQASARRHPPNPRYCHEPRCVRLAQHIGAHTDDAGRTWH